MLEGRAKYLIAAFGAIMAATVGALIGGQYSDTASKREINLQLISFLGKMLPEQKAQILFAEYPGLSDNERRDYQNSMIDYKENAFLARQLVAHLQDSFPDSRPSISFWKAPKPSFSHVYSGLTNAELRYSYAQIYNAAGLVDIICTDVHLRDEEEFTIDGDDARCAQSQLDGATIEISNIDVLHSRIEVSVKNDKNEVFCDYAVDECEFTVDRGDRLENSPYSYLMMVEYVGHAQDHGSHKHAPKVHLSIVKRRHPLPTDNR